MIRERLKGTSMASWFTGLAGKAEALLERVDQTAADRLKTPVKDTSNQANRVVDTPERPLSVEREGTVSSGLFSPVQSGLPRVASEGVLSTGRDVRSSSRSGRKSPTPSVTASLGRPKSSQLQRVSVTDEQLFEFLNAPRRESKPSPKPVLEWTSVSDSRETLNPVKSGLTVSRLDHMEGSVDSNDLEDVTDGEGGRQQTDISMPLAGTIEQGLKERVSNLELENRLLKREVTSLNQELTNVSERARHAEKHLSDARNEMEGSRQVSSRSDQLVREMHGRHDDLVQTLATRDAQIAVLRVKLQEADEKSDSNDQKVKLLKVENERVLRDHSDSQGVQQQVLEELRQKLEETENSLRDQRAVLAVSQTQTIHQQTQLESERHQLSGSLKETQRKLTEEKLRLNEQAQAVKNARTDTESARRELSEYKEKAQRILQSKDRLINELKTGVSGSDTTSFSGAVAAEVEQMRKERDLMREEAHASQLQLDHLRMELQDAEQHHQVEMDEKSERLRELEESLDDERRRREVAEQEAARRLHEVEYTQTELFREKTALQSRLHERENEVQKLKSQVGEFLMNGRRVGVCLTACLCVYLTICFVSICLSSKL